MCLVVNDGFESLMDGHTGRLHLCESSDSVLIRKQWGVFPNLEVKVDRLVRERRKLVTEAKLEGAIFGGGERETVILLLHLLVEHGPIGVLQTAINIIMTPSHHLKFQCTLGSNGDVFVKALFRIVWQLECEL